MIELSWANGSKLRNVWAEPVKLERIGPSLARARAAQPSLTLIYKSQTQAVTHPCINTCICCFTLTSSATSIFFFFQLQPNTKLVWAHNWVEPTHNMMQVLARANLNISLTWVGTRPNLKQTQQTLKIRDKLRLENVTKCMTRLIYNYVTANKGWFWFYFGIFFLSSGWLDVA